MKKKLRQLFLFLMAAVMMVTSLSLTAFADQTVNEDALIPQVFYKDHDNSDVRVIIGTTEEITIGKTSTISVTIKNTSGEDWKKAKVQIAPERLHRDYYGDVDELDWEEVL